MERDLLLVLLFASIAWSRDCHYGDDCGFPCRCINGVSCDPDTGDCPGGCDPGIYGQGWSGAGCQVGDISRGKTSTQNGVWQDMTSDRALDGNLATNASEQYCARIHNEDGSVAEWSVDLGQVSSVESLLIYSTFNPDMASTVTNFSFIVTHEDGSNRVCYEYKGRAPVGYMATLQINCIPAALGRYVVLRRFGKNNPEWLNLCEVFITGYRHIDCSLCSGPCSDVTGCATCPSGRRLPDCSRPCRRGFYGPECVYRCEACRPGTVCEPVDGHCPDGCMRGYMGDRCNMHEGSAGENPPKGTSITGYPSYSKTSSWGTGPANFNTKPDSTIIRGITWYPTSSSRATPDKQPTTTTATSQNRTETNGAQTNHLRYTLSSVAIWIVYAYLYIPLLYDIIVHK